MPNCAPRRVVCCAAIAAIAAGLAFQAVGQTRDVAPRFAVRVGAANTDNLGRRSDDVETESETFATTGVDIGFLRETRRVRAYADGTIDYYAYNSAEYENETAGSLDAGLAFHLVPERFSWESTERIDHTRLDPFAPAGPGNNERVNLFSTGPRAFIPLAERTYLGMIAQYTDRRYRDSADMGGSTRGAGLELGHDLNDVQRLSLEVTNQDLQFDDPSVRAYEIQQAFVAYERQTASEGFFAVEVGASRLRRDGESNSEPYFQLEWTREITPRSVIALEGGRRIESPADYFDSGTLLGYGLGGADDTLLTPDPRAITDASLSYTLTRPRAVFSARGERVRESYEGATLAREVWQQSVGVEYRFTPLLVGGVAAVKSEEEFEIDGLAEEERVNVSLRRRLGMSWEGSLSAEYTSREANIGESFTERRYVLALLWSPITGR